MNRPQRKPPLLISRYPAYGRAILQIEEALVCASKRHSALSDDEKIDYVRVALFGREAIQGLDSDDSAQTEATHPQ